MQLKINETRTHKVENETVNGLNICCLLESAAVNTDVPETGYMTATSFDPSQINIEVSLMRNGKSETIINENLAVLAHFWTILKNGMLWRKGVTLQASAVAKTHLVSRSVFIPFAGHINVKGSDVLTVTATVNRGAFGTGVSSATSTIQIETNQSIGVEHAIYKFKSYAIQASQNQDVVNLGDNITRLALISFETDSSKPIFKSASLSSDRLDFTANEQELILRHWDKFPYNSADMAMSSLYGTAHPSKYPSTFVIHDKDEIDRAKLQFTMNSANVAASQNFVCWITYVTDQAIISKAVEMTQKHNEQNVAKIPLSI